MRNRIPIFMGTLAVMAMSLGTSAAAAQAPRASGLGPSPAPFFYCRSDQDPQGKFYFSRVQSNPGVSIQDLQRSFQLFLVTKYGYRRSDSASCLVGNDQNLERQTTINNLRSSQFEVVDVDFTYAPASNAPAPTPNAQVPTPVPRTPASPPALAVPRPASAPPVPRPQVAARPAPVARPAAPTAVAATTRYALCFAFMPTARSVFFSEPFQVTAVKTKQWSDAFREMLRGKYQFVGTISCGVRGMTVADAQTFAQQEKIRLGQGRQFVETGWTYQEEIR